MRRNRVIALYLCSTSNHNRLQTYLTYRILPYIFVLHQTTTKQCFLGYFPNCLISLFYIKPQLSYFQKKRTMNCLISLFYIKPQLVVKLDATNRYCLISLFYIKPQPNIRAMFANENCLISLFYIKPQRILCILLVYKHLQYILHIRSGVN